MEDVIYEWHYGNELAAVASNDMRLSQFDLRGMPACNVTREFKGSKSETFVVCLSMERKNIIIFLFFYFHLVIRKKTYK